MWYKTEKIPAGDINFFLDMIPYISRHIEEIRRGEDGVEILCSEAHQEEVLASLTRLENMIGEGKFAKKDVNRRYWRISRTFRCRIQKTFLRNCLHGES